MLAFNARGTKMFALFVLLLPVAVTPLEVLTPIYPTTADRIVSNGYPVESHTTQTVDGYILTMFRIPYSLKTQNQFVSNKTVVYLQHGIVASSDDWILAGPNKALGYLLADAGYDVWLGNFRGNTYSDGHVTLSPEKESYWAFGFHENAIYDLPAAFDYIASVTGKESLHYAGHSMGTTTLFILLSLMPEYSERIRTAHMVAPVAYTEHQKSPAMRVLYPILGTHNPVSKIYSDHSIAGYNEFIALFAAKTCSVEFINQAICGNLLFLIGGFDPVNTNYSLIPDILLTHPNGGASNQIIQFIQLGVSGLFRQFDHGLIGNRIYYNQKSPPDYPLEKLRANPPIQLYYSDGDYISSSIDILRLPPRMGDNIELHKVDYPQWNHFDYLFAETVKEVINDKIIAYIEEYELLD